MIPLHLFAALPASAGLPASLYKYLQPLRPLQSEQWVPSIHSGSLFQSACFITGVNDYFLCSSHADSWGRTDSADNVDLPADQCHHTVSYQNKYFCSLLVLFFSFPTKHNITVHNLLFPPQQLKIETVTSAYCCFIKSQISIQMTFIRCKKQCSYH